MSPSLRLEQIDLTVAPLDLLECLAPERGLAFVDGVRARGRALAVLGFAPAAMLEIRADGTTAAGAPPAVAGMADPLRAIEEFCAMHGQVGSEQPFPFRSAAIGYLGYELRRFIEPGPCRARDDIGLPLVVLGWYDPLLVFDHAERRYYLCSSRERSANAAWREALDARTRGMHTPRGHRRTPVGLDATAITSNMTREDYQQAIDRIHEHITSGDVYQINLAQRLTAPFVASPLALFARLSRAHPMPLATYFDAGAFQILSNSPELFLARRGGRIVTRPIKGTRRRGTTPAEDAHLRATLAADPKERAEHVMIVDLERNDLGRVCRPGSIQVHSLATVESYPTLHHLVSTIGGHLERGVGLARILRATFPGGSITGAPKIRAMEIIDAIEPHARGVYTGALGLIDAVGDLHLNLPIRTAVTTGGSVYYGAGGGIVADSTADAEYAESLLKAEAFLGLLGARPGHLASIER